MKTSAFDNHRIFITLEKNKSSKGEAELSSSWSSDLLGTSNTTKIGSLSDFPDNEHDTDEGHTPEKAKMSKFAYEHMSSKNQIKSSEVDRIVGNVQALLDEAEELHKIVQNQDRKIKEFEKEQQNHLELISKYQSLRDENEKLKEVLKEKEIEIRKQGCKDQLITFENGRSNRLIEVLNDKICVLQTELDQLAFERMKKVDLCKQLFVEVRKLNLVICRLKKEIMTHQKENEKLKALVQEKIPNNERLSNEFENSNTIDIHKLNDEISQKDIECKSLMIKTDELESCKKALRELERKNTLISNENFRLLEEIDHLNEILENKTKEMEVKVSELMGEKESLDNMLKSTKEEMETMRKEKESMMNEHIQEVNNTKVREQYLFDEISKYMRKIEEIHKLFGVVQNKGNFGEKDPLKDLLQKANRELEEVLVRVRSKIQEVAGLQHKLAEEMEQIEEDKFKIEKMKQEMNSLKASLESVKNENIKLRGSIKYFMSIFA